MQSFQGEVRRALCPEGMHILARETSVRDTKGRCSPGGTSGKDPACQHRRCRARSPGWEDPLEEEMATHSSVLAWRIPCAEETGGYSPSGHKESDTNERLN